MNSLVKKEYDPQLFTETKECPICMDEFAKDSDSNRSRDKIEEEKESNDESKEEDK